MEPTATSVLVWQAWRVLSNGMGAIDWAGLPLVVEMLQPPDVEAFVGGLMQVKVNRPKGL